jgi:excinuclease ABC subunit A
MKTKPTRRKLLPIIEKPAIRLRGGRMHNLQNIDLDIPSGKLVIVCGVSGSGKTSLALDTLNAEGQRRYIESFSPYVRQFLPQREKPEYDRLENLPASIAVKRSGVPRTNRSTVGTTAEVDDYLRILYSRASELYCPGCDRHVVRHDANSVARWIGAQSRRKAMITFRLEWIDLQDLSMQLSTLQQSGFTRILVANKTWNLATDDRTLMASAIGGYQAGNVVVDRIVTAEVTTRIVESLETAFAWGSDSIEIFVEGDQNPAADSKDTSQSIDGIAFETHRFSRDLECAPCGLRFSEPQPSTFSFNSSLGACSTCEGLGEISILDRDKIVPDGSKSLREGAIAPWTTPAYRHELDELIALADEYRLPIDKPVSQLSEKQWKIIQHGVPARSFGGLDGFFAWLDQRKYKMHLRIFAARWKSYQACPACHGKRLKPEALAFRIDRLSIDQALNLSIRDAIKWLVALTLTDNQRMIASDALKQIRSRLQFLSVVGLDYLSLNRPLRTLSGGEATRVSLTTSLGSDLVSMLYVLDEPTIGLHPHDTEGLIRSIEGLRDRGNTVLVVEHEPQLIERADWLIEIGPRAGREGGKVCFQGTIDELKRSNSKTGYYLNSINPGMPASDLMNGDLSVRPIGTNSFLDSSLTSAERATGGERENRSEARPARPEPVSIQAGASGPGNRFLRLRNAHGRNLKNMDVDFPLGCLCVVTGVSGSGKSTLVLDTLGAAMMRAKNKKTEPPLAYDSLSGDDSIRDCVVIDQDPLSLSSRSNPATYTKILDDVRRLFAELPEAKRLGYSPGHFSFNNKEGQCSRCEGEGTLTIDMQFLTDIQTACPDCKGSRYRSEILDVKYRDRSIADCLSLSVDEAKSFFRGQAKIQKKLDKLFEIGLGYLVLGQSLSTISAGEAQRIKLANYLTDSEEAGTLFLMDEPTTGLHFSDVERLVDVLRRLIAAGHSVIVIEHNEQMMRAADYLIDLGPGPAEQGGQVVATGSLQEITSHPLSITGKYLRAPFH